MRVKAVALGIVLALAGLGATQAQTCGKEATRCITSPKGGDCASIGTWNAATKTCTLRKDLTGESIQIAGDGITLDGGGHTLTGASLGDLLQPFGVLVKQRTGVSISNLTVRKFMAGIQMIESSKGAVTRGTMHDTTRAGIELLESDNNRIAGNRIHSSADGILVIQSAGNLLEGNTTELNRSSGIILSNSATRNVLRENVTRGNSGGITLGGDSDYNTLTGNEVIGNSHLGIAIYFYSNENVVLDNSIAGNAVGVENGAGILVMQSSGNRFTNNTVTGNSRGIWISYPDTELYDGGDNEVYNNNFLANRTQALVTGRRSTADTFGKQAPIGGNFWDNWTAPDANGDRIVDTAYAFSGSGDPCPWRVESGWNAPPEATRATSPPDRSQASSR
jgi:parallel beta-helix repeat protein